jgi:hypothetical protein
MRGTSSSKPRSRRTSLFGIVSTGGGILQPGNSGLVFGRCHATAIIPYRVSAGFRRPYPEVGDSHPARPYPKHDERPSELCESYLRRWLDLFCPSLGPPANHVDRLKTRCHYLKAESFHPLV